MKLALASSLIAGAFATAPIFSATTATDAIEGQYIVKIAPGSVDKLDSVHALLSSGVVKGAKVNSKININNKFLGFAANLGPEALAAVAELPGVEYIEQDAMAHASQQDIRDAGLWGLDRNDGTFDNEYRYPARAGDGSVVYVLDTGIRVSHNDFEGRAVDGANCLTGTCTAGNAGDGNGHGTHCAGTVGGTKHGLAKDATLVAVKVLGDSGSGSFAGIIAGISWADEDCASRGADVCIQSMSLGGGRNQALNDAVDAVFGRSLVIAASGNSNADARTFSPASAGRAFAVNSAQRVGDNLSRSSFSNYGADTQIFSAGSSVLSAYHTSDSATATLSGTSMACPHVAGGAAVCISEGSRDAQAVWDCLIAGSDEDVLGSLPTGTPNLYFVNRR